MRQVLAQEELRLMATPRQCAIRTLDFPEQNQPGAVARGTGREGKMEEASHGVGWGNSCGSPPRARAGPPPPLLCVSWSGGGALRTAPLAHSSHSLRSRITSHGDTALPGCLQLLQGAPSRWLCLQRPYGDLDGSQGGVSAPEPGPVCAGARVLFVLLLLLLLV